MPISYFASFGTSEKPSRGYISRTGSWKSKEVPLVHLKSQAGVIKVESMAKRKGKFAFRSTNAACNS